MSLAQEGQIYSMSTVELIIFKVLEVSIIAILLQSLQNYEFIPERANSFNRHSLAYILKIPGISIIAVLLQSLQNYEFDPERANSFNGHRTAYILKIPGISIIAI